MIRRNKRANQSVITLARAFSSRACRNRRGAAVVEFAVVAPLFFLLIFGIIEFGRMVMVQQILTNASREGARRAVVESASGDEVETYVNNYLSNASVAGATITITPSNLDSAGFGDPVTVTVSIPFDSVSWTASALYLQGTELEASSMMQAERLQ